MDNDPTRNRNLLLGASTVAVILAEIVAVLILDLTAAAGNQSPIAGDPGLYDAIVAALFRGDIPYVDTPVEHLPGALVPMVAIKGVANLFGLSFEVMWPVAMGVLFIASVGLADRMPTTNSSGRRFLLLSLPMLPLVLFRVEPWLMLWVVISIVAAFKDSWRVQSMSAFVAAITKGWPLVLYVLPFRRSHQRLAIAFGAVTTVAIVTVAVLPGFQQGRAFDGIHVETLMGSLFLMVRGLLGNDLQVIATAGATYTAAPTVAVILNGLIGLPFIAISGVLIFRTTDLTRLVRLVGLGVLGIILMSPLLSAQFVYWLVPFAVLITLRLQQTYVVVGALTLATIAVWDPFSVLWSSTVFARNLLLLVLAIAWAHGAILGGRTQPIDTTQRTSRRNFPV